MADQFAVLLAGSTFSRINVAGITACREQQATLREYHTRLIADVVTGKFDVCEAASRLPEDEDVEKPFEDEGDTLIDTNGDAVDDPDVIPREAEE